VSKSNWAPTDKIKDPYVLQYSLNFISKIKRLTILKENNNIDQLESLVLWDISKNKNFVFFKSRQKLSNSDKGYMHYLPVQQIKTHLFPQTSVKVSKILNRLRNSGIITGRQLYLYLRIPRLLHIRHILYVGVVEKSPPTPIRGKDGAEIPWGWSLLECFTSSMGL